MLIKLIDRNIIKEFGFSTTMHDRCIYQQVLDIKVNFHLLHISSKKQVWWNLVTSFQTIKMSNQSEKSLLQPSEPGRSTGDPSSLSPSEANTNADKVREHLTFELVNIGSDLI